MTHVVGIDLGTTNSLVAVIEGDQPVLIPNAMGDFWTPSVVGISQDDEVLVGRPARGLAASTPERCRGSFKRDMSTKSPGRKLGGQKLSGRKLRGRQLGGDRTHLLVGLVRLPRTRPPNTSSTG